MFNLATITTPGAIIGYRKNGLPIRLIAGGSEAAPEPSTEPETGGDDTGTTPPADPTPDPKPEPDKGKAKDPADELAKWKALSRQNETAAKEARKAIEKAEQDKQSTLDAIARALGLKKGEEVDPAKLAEQLTGERDTARSELRQTRIELAIYETASKHGAKPSALRDSRSFLSKVADLDPSDKGFRDALIEAAKEAVKDNPALAAEASKPPARSGAEMTGAPGGAGGGKRPTSLAAAVANHLRT